jgi:hypothetical protein
MFYKNILGLDHYYCQGRAHTKETGKRNGTAISEKNRRFEEGNWNVARAH